MERRFGREAAIERLVEHTLKAIHQDPDGQILKDMVRRGFRGFEKLTDSGLLAELEMRGLSVAAELHEMDESEDFGVDEELEESLGEMLAPGFMHSPGVERAD